MNYSQTLEYMYSKLPMYQRIGKAAYKADLETSIDFDNYLNKPHKKYKTIHIAGTNGKGSVSHILSSILQEVGYKTGLYTSPHLKSFRERIKINGEMIEKQSVVEFIENHKEFIEKKKPSFFEMTVFMAFEYFKQKKVDVAIIEVGMGGRLDSTNVIYPEVSVITNISLDHTAFLGNDLRKIANEKAGIIKQNIPVVIGEKQTEIEDIFKNKANEKKSDLYFASEFYKIDYVFHQSYEYQVFNIKDVADKIVYKDLQLDLAGKYQSKNLITVLKTIDILNIRDFNINDNQIYAACKNVKKNTNFIGRWQIMGNNPLIIADTGHNYAGIKEIVEQLQMTPYKKLHIVFGTVNDKNILDILKLLPKDAQYYFTNAKIQRAMSVDRLFETAKQLNFNGEKYNSVNDAFKSAKQNAEKNDLIFVGGSTFVLAEIL